LRRVSPIAVHPDEGPFTIPFADLHQCKPVGFATYALADQGEGMVAGSKRPTD
jgi:hypothetical protein